VSRVASSDEVIHTFSTLLEQTTAEVRELRRVIQEATPNIIGWDNFNDYKKEVSVEFKEVHSVLNEVKEVCTDYKTEKAHLVDQAALGEAKREAIDLGLSKIDFDKFLESDTSYKKELLDKVTDLKEQSAIGNWTICRLKQVLQLKPIQAFIISLCFLTSGAYSNSLADRLGDSGIINRAQELPASVGLTLFLLLIIFVAIKKS